MFVTYPAILCKEDNGDYSIFFPGFEGATYGNDLNDSYRMAIDWLGINLMDYFIEKKPFPKSMELKDVSIKNYFEELFDNEEDKKDKEYCIKNSFKTLIGFDFAKYMRETKETTVRKNVTIPSWMNEVAKNYNINFSKLLKEALERELDLGA